MKDGNLTENIKEKIPLKEYSTFKIGGDAKYFCKAANQEEVKNALDFAIENKAPVFIIGKGSNLLISDQGFGGLVLKIENQDIKIKETNDGLEADLGAGILLTNLVLDFQKDGIGGLEWSAGIPATLGGAICNNAGANGKDISESVKSVKVLEMKFNEQEGYLENYEFREMLKEECGFEYRKSVFKESKKYAIIGATLLFQRKDKEEMKKEIDKNMENRRLKQPLEYPNVGSIFKNPILMEDQKKAFIHCSNFGDVCRNNIVPAGWLIEQVGLKGKKIGGAMVSEKHANFIINTGDAKAEDVVILISVIKQKIRSKFGIQLQEEIEYVGF